MTNHFPQIQGWQRPFWFAENPRTKQMDAGCSSPLIIGLEGEMEAMEIAKAILRISGSSDLNALESGPFGGYPITIGDELIAESIDAPLSSDLPWSAAGVSDLSLTQFVHQLVEGRVWLPQMPHPDPQPIPISMVDDVCHIGPTDNNIVGNGSQTAFTLERTLAAAPTYPMLWGHNALRERRLIVAPDSEGRVKRGRESRAAEIWETRSHNTPKPRLQVQLSAPRHRVYCEIALLAAAHGPM